MKGLPLAIHRCLCRTADQFWVSHVVLTFKLVLHIELVSIICPCKTSLNVKITWPTLNWSAVLPSHPYTCTCTCMASGSPFNKEVSPMYKCGLQRRFGWIHTWTFTGSWCHWNVIQCNVTLVTLSCWTWYHNLKYSTRLNSVLVLRSQQCLVVLNTGSCCYS